MKLIIDIPKVVKYKVYNYGLSLCPSDKDQLIHAIVNGTPIPENHGRILDLDTVIVEEDTNKGVLWLDAPTILEASYGK